MVQHGESKPKEEDPERPLSENGRAEVSKVAAHLASKSVKPAKILHSSKLRAKQTAEIMSQALGVSNVSETEGITPMDDPKIAAGIVNSSAASLMLVGHLPHLSKLASLLITGDAEKAVVSFRMGGVVCLSKEESGWLVKWFLRPELV